MSFCWHSNRLLLCFHFQVLRIMMWYVLRRTAQHANCASYRNAQTVSLRVAVYWAHSMGP